MFKRTYKRSLIVFSISSMIILISVNLAISNKKKPEGVALNVLSNSWNPHFAVNPVNNRMHGSEWLYSDTATIYIDDDADLSNGFLWPVVEVDINEWGDFDIWLEAPIDIEPGQFITVTDGLVTKYHVVTSLTVDDIAEIWVDNMGPFSVGSHTVNLNIKDKSGEIDTCQASITVVDETPPDIFFSYHDCVNVGKGKGEMSNKLSVIASDNCTDEVNLVIDKVEVFNYGGQLVLGKGIYDIIGNDVYVYPNANGRSIKVTVTAIDESGNPKTQILEKALYKCKK